MCEHVCTWRGTCVTQNMCMGKSPLFGASSLFAPWDPGTKFVSSTDTVTTCTGHTPAWVRWDLNAESGSRQKPSSLTQKLSPTCRVVNFFPGGLTVNANHSKGQALYTAVHDQARKNSKVVLEGILFVFVLYCFVWAFFLTLLIY